MAIRNLSYEGDDILNKKSREIETIDEKLQTLIDDMIDTMHKYNGVGLAAVQVGILKRVFVVDLYDDKGPIVFINPVILKTNGKIPDDDTIFKFASLQFQTSIECLIVILHYLMYHWQLWTPGLHYHQSALSFSSCSSCHLRHHHEGMLPSPEIRHIEHRVGRQYAHHADIIKVQSLCHHLRSDEQVGLMR